MLGCNYLEAKLAKQNIYDAVCGCIYAYDSKAYNTCCLLFHFHLHSKAVGASMLTIQINTVCCVCLQVCL